MHGVDQVSSVPVFHTFSSNTTDRLVVFARTRLWTFVSNLVASGYSETDWTASYSTVQICFANGLVSLLKLIIFLDFIWNSLLLTWCFLAFRYLTVLRHKGWKESRSSETLVFLRLEVLDQAAAYKIAPHVQHGLQCFQSVCAVAWANACGTELEICLSVELLQYTDWFLDHLLFLSPSVLIGVTSW